MPYENINGVRFPGIISISLSLDTHKWIFKLDSNVTKIPLQLHGTITTLQKEFAAFWYTISKKTTAQPQWTTKLCIPEAAAGYYFFLKLQINCTFSLLLGFIFFILFYYFLLFNLMFLFFWLCKIFFFCNISEHI